MVRLLGTVVITAAVFGPKRDLFDFLFVFATLGSFLISGRFDSALAVPPPISSMMERFLTASRCSLQVSVQGVTYSEEAGTMMQGSL